MRSGSVSRRETWAPPTNGSGSSSWPTPYNFGAGNGPDGNNFSTQVRKEAAKWPSPRSEDSENCGNHPDATDSLTGATKNWPTPTGRPEAPNTNSNQVNGPTSLGEASESWRTPGTRDFHAGGPRKDHPQRQIALVDQAQRWPTPTQEDSQGSGGRKSPNCQPGTSLTDATKEWPTPNVPNGGRSMSPEDVRAKGATAKGKRQVGLENVAKLFSLDSETSESTSSPAQKTESGTTTPDGTSGARGTAAAASKGSRESSAPLWPTPRTITGGAESAERKKELGRENSGGGDLQAAADLWRTPQVCSPQSMRGGGGDAAKRAAQGHQINLQDQAASWPTPRADSKSGSRTEDGNPEKDGAILDQMAKNWPTPGANDMKGSYQEGQRRGQLDEAVEVKFPSSRLAPAMHSGPTSSETSPTSRPRLNPAFVSWLMGAPWWWTRAERISFASQEMELWLFKARSLLSFLTADSEQD